MKHRPMVIVAGGTGGHVFPALTVAEQLRELGIPVIWMGTRLGLESRVVPNHGYEIVYITVCGLRGKGMIKLLTAPLMICVAFIQSIVVLLRRRPVCVLGMGGYATGPSGLASWMLRIPLLIHEQNAVAGLTNRILARFAGNVMEAFPGVFPSQYKALHTGNPVRKEILAVSNPESRFSKRANGLRLLILGGSQGARVFNEIVPAALSRLGQEKIFDIYHQTGERSYQDVVSLYKELGIPARIEAFVDDMAAAYEWADIVLSRAGAMTIAELAASGAASILVPYPFAVDDHQTHNARYLSEAGAALLLPQDRLTAEVFSQLLLEFHNARTRILDMAKNARKLAMPDAAQRIAGLCLEVNGA